MSTPIIERRLQVRHRASTRVQVRHSKLKKMCISGNLSPNGVGIKTNGMQLRVGQTIELSFAIDLQRVVKIHRRNARVAHITNGVTGFIMDPFLKAVK